MSKLRQLRVRLFAISEKTINDTSGTNETDTIIENFERLLQQDEVYGKRWSCERSKNTESEHTFDLGGGRYSLPHRQLIFDNTPMPACMTDDLHEQVEPQVVEWCQSADVMVLCINMRSKPDAAHIARCMGRIRKVDDKKILVYAATNCETTAQASTFDEYADQELMLNCELGKKLYLPFVNSERFIRNSAERVVLQHSFFCFTSDYATQIAALLFCINTLYRDKIAFVGATDNPGFEYIVTNINTEKRYNMAEKSIRIAVVGAAGNGKSHFIHDMHEVLKITNRTIVGTYSGYGEVSKYINEIVGKKHIAQTDATTFMTREQHYKGDIENLDYNIEFMDIPGEAFEGNPDAITGIYQNIKNLLAPRWKSSKCRCLLKFRKNKAKQPLFIENEVESNKTLNYSEEDANDSKKVDGKYVWEHIEEYDTKSVVAALKKVVLKNKGIFKKYEGFIAEDESKQEDMPNWQKFWNFFYAYYFCDHCNDIVFCELFALPGKQKVEEDAFKKLGTCIRGAKNFLTGKENIPRMYVVFKGLDAMLKQDVFRSLYPNNFGCLDNSDFSALSEKVYLLVLLAIYKKYRFDLDKYNQFVDNSLNVDNSFLNDEEVQNIIKCRYEHLNNVEFPKDTEKDAEKKKEATKKILNDILDNILLNQTSEDNGEQRTNFYSPYTNFKEMHEHIQNRIQQLIEVNQDRFRKKTGIIPHLYFTAFPIDRTTLDIYRNDPDQLQKFGKLDIESRVPLGTFNFIQDLLKANGVAFNKQYTDLENYLYNA